MEEINSIQQEILDAGVQIVPAPSHPIEGTPFDEAALDLRLRIDLPHQGDVTRATDVDSLKGIYHLRKYQGKRFLEKSVAIFITTNKGLADSSVRYFQNLFKEQNEKNSVQICMTDVVFATRLWTKLPTSLENLPRNQIIAHTLANLKPSKQLRESFLKYLNEHVGSGKIGEADADYVKLSGYVDSILGLDFESSHREMSKDEFISTYNKVINLHREKNSALITEGVSERTKKIEEQIDKISKEIEIASKEIENKDTEIESLKKEAEKHEISYHQISKARENVSNIVTAITKPLVIFISIAIIISYTFFISIDALLTNELIDDLGWNWLKETAKTYSKVYVIVGPVDKRDSQKARVVIQDFFLEGGFDAWRLVGCGMGGNRVFAAA